MQIDLLIVGAGPVGCVIAERAANELGLHVLIIDKRNHLAGNCFDHQHQSGILVHQYGPHYFRTDNAALIDYLSRFTEWIEGNYIVKIYCQGQLFPFPINLTTLEQFFKRDFDQNQARQFINQIREKIGNPANAEEFVLSQVGKELYEAFYKNYSTKQWGRPPSELEASVTKRIPIRFDRNEKYVNQKYQLMPKAGYTAMFKAMLQHPNIEIKLDTDYKSIKSKIKPALATIYCGPLDEYFDYSLGHLPWRSLTFDFQEKSTEFFQPCVQINYPNDFDYTRAVEIKHVTGQIAPNTVVTYEYPSAVGDPYYPVPLLANEKLLARYQELAEHEQKAKNIFFVGRLAQYRYINTDEAIEKALETFAKIKSLAKIN